MNKVLIVAEHDTRGLSVSTAKTVACAQDIPDASIDICVFADAGQSVAEQAAALDGVARVLNVSDELHAHPLAAYIAPQMAELGTDYTHLLAPSTTFGRDLMPRVAALMNTVQVSEVMSVESATRFRRPIYAGNAIATVEVDCAPVVATVRIASFQPVDSGTARAPIESATPAKPAATHTRFVSHGGSDGSDKVDLQSAQRVVSGGRGVGSAEAFALLEALAAQLGAAVGASRAAVDAGFVPNEMQVGQTGKIIAPDLYIAAGISGAIQHLTGIRDAGTIVAINRDPEAPIFELADIGLVGDLFAVLPELTDKIRTLKS